MHTYNIRHRLIHVHVQTSIRTVRIHAHMCIFHSTQNQTHQNHTNVSRFKFHTSHTEKRSREEGENQEGKTEEELKEWRERIRMST